ncbi:MAG: response regulator transcription factor [Acidimicrobiales bacterium]
MSSTPDVLVVDDDPDIREMLGFTLGTEFSIRYASSGSDAIEQLTLRPPAAMVLDVMMPGIDGYDVLEVRRDRGLAPDTCIVMLTCKSDERDLIRSWGLGAAAHLTKPTDPEQIAAELRAHLAARPSV